MQPLSILVADDEESIRVVVAKLLGTAGHTVTVVKSAREAVGYLQKGNFDLVITDVLMPDGDGVDLIADVRKLQPGARIIAMSGGGRYLEGSDYLRLARGLGAHMAIAKPFNWEQLQAAMASAMPPVSGNP